MLARECLSRSVGCLSRGSRRHFAPCGPTRAELNVSHETIYNAIYMYPKGELRRDLIACLRRGRSSRNFRSAGADRHGQTPEILSVHVRPLEVDDRVMPGHGEGDLIKGAGNRWAVDVLAEHSTRLVLRMRMPDALAESALAAFTAKLNQIATLLRQTLTSTQGRVRARQHERARNSHIRVYFCAPHRPWQRGYCDNIDGLLRQTIPKGTDLSVQDQDALDSMADLLDNRPRKTLSWRNPIQAFRELMRLAKKGHATIH